MKNLEEILNLPESKKTIKKAEKEKADEVAQPFLRDMSEFDKIAASLPAVKGLGDAADSEFDALAQRATDAYDDLMDLGMNVEARYSGRIFEVAGGMLKNAIDAKAAKIDKKLKMIELQLKKVKLDRELAGDSVEHPTGQGHVLDRNELLRQVLGKNNV